MPSQETEMATPCRWTEDREYGWDTACGHTFVFIDDGPQANGFCYCCFCGRILQPEPLTENDHETAT